MWRKEISETAAVGLIGDLELIRVGPRKVRYKDSPLSAQKAETTLREAQKSEEHKKKIAEAIRKKWLDPVKL